jgi:hypothetical protein
MFRAGFMPSCKHGAYPVKSEGSGVFDEKMRKEKNANGTKR